MKVLVLGHYMFSADMAWGFNQAGHSAQIIKATTADQIERILGGSDTEILITLGAPTEIRREVLEAIGRRQSPHYRYIHWDTDGISSTYFGSVSGDGIEMDDIYWAKPDLVLTMCPEMLELVRSKGFPCEFMYYGYSPNSHHPIPGYNDSNRYISLIGNSYYMILGSHPDHYRYQSLKILLKPLVDNGYPVHLYGENQYPPLIKKLLGLDIPAGFYHGFLPYEQTCAAYNNSYINLVTQNHQHTITKRTFEVLGSGGFVLSADNSGLRELFVPGRDLVVSSSPEQTLEMVRYYWENPDEWSKVRENAVLSVQNHTYKQRAEYFVQKIQEYWPKQ